MAKKVKPIPDGYHSVTPYLIVDDGARAIDFYKRAFGAKELMRMPAPGGKVGHAEIKIGDSVIMLADEAPEMDARSAEALRRLPGQPHAVRGGRRQAVRRRPSPPARRRRGR